MGLAALKSPATYDDLLAVPDHLVAEILNGDLYASPRPALLHARAASVLGASVTLTFPSFVDVATCGYTQQRWRREFASSRTT
jgi:hypothetical protein